MLSIYARNTQAAAISLTSRAALGEKVPNFLGFLQVTTFIRDVCAQSPELAERIVFVIGISVY